MGWLQGTYNKFENFIDRSEHRLGDDMSSVCYVLISTTTHVSMMAWARVHVDDITPVQTQYIRGILITILIYLYSTYKDISLSIADRKWDNMRIARNVIASLFNVLTFFIITKVPMSTILVIQTSCPFMVAFLDRLINKTTYNKVEVIFSFTSVLGVIFLIKPDLFLDIEIKNQGNYAYAEGAERLFYIGLFLVGCVFYSISIILVKALKGMNPMAMNFPFGICMATSSPLLEIEYNQLKNPPMWIYLQALIALGIITFINQHAFVKANQLGKPAKVSLLNNLTVVWSFLFELFYLQEQREWYSFAGAALIVGSSLALSISRLIIK